MPPKLPQELQYRRFLGEGRIGRTYLAYNTSRERLSVVKEILLGSLSELTVDKLLDELNTVRTIAHPRLSRILHVHEGSCASHIFVEREYHDGNTLQDLLDVWKYSQSRPSIDEIWYIIAQILEILAYMHAGGVRRPHLNLKPSNVLLSWDKVVTICDCGLSALAGDSSSTRGFSSSEAYKSPEIILWNAGTAPADIWSVGCLLYELLVFKLPPFLMMTIKDTFNTACYKDLEGIQLNTNADKYRIQTQENLQLFLKARNTPVFTSSTDDKPQIDRILEFLFTEDESRSLGEHEDAIKVFLKNTVCFEPAERLTAESLLLFPQISDALIHKGNTYNDSSSEQRNPSPLPDSSNSHSHSTISIKKMRVHSSSAVWNQTQLLPLREDMDLSSTECTSSPIIPACLSDATQPDLFQSPSYQEILSLAIPVSRDQNGDTPLMRAARRGDLEDTLLYLKMAGLVNNQGKTALILAIEERQVEIVKTLLPLELNVKLSNNLDPYDIAKQVNNSSILRLLECVVQPTVDSHGRTRLMRAARRGDAAKVYKYRHEMRRTDKTGLTALMHAGIKGHVSCVKELLRETRMQQNPEDSNTGLQRLNGMTALMYATINGHIDCVAILSKYELGMQTAQGVTAMMIAAQRNYTDAIELLLEGECLKKFGISRTGKMFDRTALMIAAEWNAVEAVHILAEHESGLRNADGDTALMLAVDHQHERVVEILAKYEGGMRDVDGNTALMLACMKGYAGCASILYPYEKQHIRSDGWTPLHSAAEGGNVRCLYMFLNKYARYQLADGYTALMRAAETGSIPCCKVLAKFEWDLNCIDGAKPEDYAADDQVRRCIE